MSAFFLKRIFQALIAVIGVMTLIFFLQRLTGDPVLLLVPQNATQADIAAMRETLRLLGEGGEPTFLATQHGMGLIPAEVRARRSLGPAPRR